MELFPAQPDLSLQISPPSSSKPSSKWSTATEESIDMGFWRRALNSNSPAASAPSLPPENSAEHGGTVGFDLSLSNSTTSPTTSFDHQHHPHFPREPYLQDPAFLRPIHGIPVYHSAHSFPFPPPSHHYHSLQHHHLHICNSSARLPSRFLPRFPAKRSMRAPRMRWTSTLHARFVHAVELLGGHERATPKSVLELMDVNDLTLAHVKSHLQMYRTVKATDKPASSSGQSDPIEISDDNLFDIHNFQGCDHSSGQEGSSAGQNSTKSYGLWSNLASKGGFYHDKPRESTTGSLSFLESKMRSRSLEMTSGLNSSCLLENCSKKPNLDFTLGRPQ